MGFAAPVLAVAGPILGAVGAIMGGESQAAAYGRMAQQQAYQAQVARNNATIANQTAEAEVKAGQRDAEMRSLQTAARVAKVKAGFAARGVDVNTGSAVDVQASERELGKIDTETALSNAQLKAYGYRSRATGYQAEAGLYDAASRSQYASAADARTGSYFKAASSLLSAASAVPSSWLPDLGGGSSGGQSIGAIYSGPI